MGPRLLGLCSHGRRLPGRARSAPAPRPPRILRAEVVAPSDASRLTPLKVLAVVLSVGTIALIARDGESHWMEGVQLLAVYVILGIAFFFLPG